MINITLLKLKDCQKCDKAKEVLANAKKDYPINLKEIWFEDNEGKALAIEKGIKYAPAVIINDEKFSEGGLSEIRLTRKLLELSNH